MFFYPSTPTNIRQDIGMSIVRQRLVSHISNSETASGAGRIHAHTHKHDESSASCCAYYSCPGSCYCPVNTPDPPHQHTIRGNKIGDAYRHPWVHPTPNTALEGIDRTHADKASTAKHCARKRRARLSENPTDPYVSGRFGTCTHHFRHQPRAGATCSSNAVLSRVGSCVSSMRIEQGRG